MTEAEADPDVRVIVVTGCRRRTLLRRRRRQGARGPRRQGRLRRRAPRRRTPDAAGRRRLRRRLRLPAGHAHAGRSPSVNGAAAGVGLVIACFADIRFAATGAKLTTAAPKLGFPAEYGLSWLLPRLVGAGRAADWLLSGRVFLTDEAAEVGLFSAVLPADRARRPTSRTTPGRWPTTCRPRRWPRPRPSCGATSSTHDPARRRPRVDGAAPGDGHRPRLRRGRRALTERGRPSSDARIPGRGDRCPVGRIRLRQWLRWPRPTPRPPTGRADHDIGAFSDTPPWIIDPRRADAGFPRWRWPAASSGPSSPASPGRRCCPRPAAS